MPTTEDRKTLSMVFTSEVLLGMEPISALVDVASRTLGALPEIERREWIAGFVMALDIVHDDPELAGRLAALSVPYAVHDAPSDVIDERNDFVELVRYLAELLPVEVI